jgi:hypothetical protein
MFSQIAQREIPSMNEIDPPKIADSVGSKSHEGSSRATTALCAAAAFVGAIGAVTLPFVVMPWVRGQNLPYMATPKGKLQKAFQFLMRHRQRHHSVLAERQRFVDLGSGDGEVVYQALQIKTSSSRNKGNFASSSDVERPRYYFSRCTGIELNSTLCLWSCVRRFFWTRHDRQRSRFLCRNMFHSGNRLLEEADAVFIFGIPSLMTTISQLLRRNCRRGTYILCYRFPLPVKNGLSEEGEENEDEKLLSAQLIYDEEEMHIYECTDENKLKYNVDDS